MQPESKIMLPCGNMGILYVGSKEYICNYCHSVVGSADEPTNCKALREKSEPYKNDYWMNINDDQIN